MRIYYQGPKPILRRELIRSRANITNPNKLIKKLLGLITNFINIY